MELVAVSAIIVLGFSFISYLGFRERSKLQLLIKAGDLHEVKQYEKEKEEVKFEDITPESLTEAFAGKDPEEIKAAFNAK